MGGVGPKWRCTLAWRNPYIAPPGPRVLASVLCERPHPVPPEIMDLWQAGSGYSIGWELVEQRPIRRWSSQAKARVRQANLKKRITRRYPLFADLFISAELAARPSYYSAED